VLIGVVGDCTLDVSIAEPLEPTAAGGDARARLGLGPGGQAANMAVRLARRGQAVRLVCPLADDAAGDVLRAAMRRERVDLVALPAPQTSMVVAFVHPGGERSMLSDRVQLEGDLAAALNGTDWVHLSGYALRERLEAERVVTSVRGVGTRWVSVAGGSFGSWADARIARDAIDAMGAALLVVNRDEAGLLAGNPYRTAADAAQRLARSDRLVVVTDGRRGCAAAGLGVNGTLAAEAPATAVLDATGAGDAFTAELLSRLAPAWPPHVRLIHEALAAASQAGGEASAQLGAQAPAAREADGQRP
jgi:sugar/nucleoside kinase (ribokinase family)